MTVASYGLNGFCSTSIWRERFMKRYGLAMKMKTRITQKMPEDYKKIIEFYGFIISGEKGTDYELD